MGLEDLAARWAFPLIQFFRFLAEEWTSLVDEYRSELRFALFIAVWTAIRRSGVVVKTGQHALRYTLGRAGRILGPGFHPMVPFVQVARVAPTRSRTLELEPQRVTTFDGLVYRVEANLVWRITDLRKALIEVDDLVKGMLEMLGLGVQEVVRGRSREELRDPSALDAELSRRLTERLTPWGVTVEHAGFTSITPSRVSLRVTQIEQVTAERLRTLRTLLDHGLSRPIALGLLGTRKRFLSHGRFARERGAAAARRRRVTALLLRAGLERVQIRRAELARRPGEPRPERASPSERAAVRS